MDNVLRRRIFPIVSAMIVTATALPLKAQVAGVDLPAPATIQEAEAEGAAFPREAPPPSLPFGFGDVNGTQERKCVAFPDGGVLSANWIQNSRRSGDFVVGAEIIQGLQAGGEAKVFWVPLHDPASRNATLLVRSVRLDQPAITSRFVGKDYAFPMKEQRSPIKDSAVDREHGFYPSGFSLPSAGRWLLIATSGPDWGCFIVTVK
jgi:hypothetical protein